jgi:RNA polymerase sigma-70 factor (ECF subfamily)
LSATTVQLFQFDEQYLRLLRQGHRTTQDHFVSYFTKLLRIKLRSKKLTAEHMFDVQQETFLRVLVTVRTGEIHQPDRLGSFVNSTCNNVLFEWYRDNSRIRHADLDAVDVPDGNPGLEAQMIAQEQAKKVRAVIAKLPPRDEAVLRALLQGRDKDQICTELEVDRKYLRVLTHRAIASFRDQYRKDSGRMNHAARR